MYGLAKRKYEHQSWAASNILQKWTCHPLVNYGRGPSPSHPDRMRDATSANGRALAQAVAAPASSLAGFWFVSRVSASSSCQNIFLC